jgi:hypothetical protein
LAEKSAFHANSILLLNSTGLNYWLINAFNGEWLRTEDPVPIRGGVSGGDGGRRKLKRELDGLAAGGFGFEEGFGLQGFED